MGRFVVYKNISLKAPPYEVWDALTNPEKTKKYFLNCEVLSDWKAGSPIIFKGKIFLIKNIELHGEILKIKPQKFLQYTLNNRAGDRNLFSTVTIKLRYEYGETTVSISDDVGEGEGAQKRYRRSAKAWNKVLEGLKEVVEEEAVEELFL